MKVSPRIVSPDGGPAGAQGVDGDTIVFAPGQPRKRGELVHPSATTGTPGLDRPRPVMPTIWHFRALVPGGSSRFLDSGQALGGLPSLDVEVGGDWETASKRRE